MITEKIIRDFKEYLVQIGYGKGSIYMLPRCTEEFLEYHTITAPETITPQHIENFYQWLQIRPNRKREGGLSEVRIYGFIYALRVFFNWLEASGRITQNPISGLTFPYPQSSPRNILTRGEAAELLRHAQTLRDKAILALFYGCGLRRMEAVRLNTADIHYHQQILYVRKGKGNKRRAIPMTAKITETLKNFYLYEREHYVKNISAEANQAFLLNKAGRRMSGQNYFQWLKKLIAQTGDAEIASKNISLHSLRHSIATHLLENGISLEQVRDFLGHEFLDTTKIYTRITEKQLQEL